MTTLPNEFFDSMIQETVIQSSVSKTIARQLFEIDTTHKHDIEIKTAIDALPSVQKVEAPMENGKSCEYVSTDYGVLVDIFTFKDRLDISEEYCKNIDRVSIISMEPRRVGLYEKAFEQALDLHSITDVRAHANIEELVGLVTDAASAGAVIDAINLKLSDWDDVEGAKVLGVNTATKEHFIKYAETAGGVTGYIDNEIFKSHNVVKIKGVYIYSIRGTSNETINGAGVKVAGTEFLADGQYVGGLRNAATLYIDQDVSVERFGNSKYKDGANMILSSKTNTVKSWFYGVNIPIYKKGKFFKESV